jgi:predicted AAA+ superfamily ATPase
MLISQINTGIVRDMMHSVNWEKQLVAIRGSRGVGKTTLIRQYIKQKFGISAGEALYCVMDSMYFANHTLLELAEQFHLMGGTHLFLDEVHRYPTWSREIKEIIDLYPNMKITFTGSSLIQILNADADLSRRVLSYTMEGLSFREYLQFYKGIHIPVYGLEDIMTNYDDICAETNKMCHPQPLFEEYLRVGYFPFYDGDEEEYYSRIENVIDFIVGQELPQFCGVDPANTRKVKALIQFLADSVPYELNIAKLSARLELNKNTVLSYINSLGRAELLMLLYSDSKTITRLQKPDKIYLHDPNMFYALGFGEKIGTIRECFLINQLSVNHTVEYGKEQGDFIIDGNITIEVGGPDKTFEQVVDIPNSYIFADRIEFPVGKKIPLWMAGLVY